MVSFSDMKKPLMNHGIHDNVSLTKVGYSPGFLDFFYEKDGRELKVRRFITDENSIVVQEGEDIEEAKKNIQKRFLNSLWTVAAFFCTMEELQTAIGSKPNTEELAKEFASYLNSILKEKSEETKLRLKVIRNNKGYPDCPSYNYIESMNSESSLEFTVAEKAKIEAFVENNKSQISEEKSSDAPNEVKSSSDGDAWAI